MLQLEHYAETLTIRKAHQKNLETFETWCWRRMEISWTENVRNKALQRGTKERTILYTTQRRKTNLNAYTLYRNYLLKHIMEKRQK
jgi:hypothetical protein